MSEFVWPFGYKSAFCISWDMDGEAAQYFRNPEEARNQIAELVQRSYGPTVGIYKILDMLDNFEVKGTFFIPGYTALTYPDSVKAIVEKKHSLGLHGFMHETLDKLDNTLENEMFKKSINAFKKLGYNVPNVFRSPSFEWNRRTPNILINNSIIADSSLMGDDKPYIIKTEFGEIIEIPVQWILDDFEFWGHTKANRQKPISNPDTVIKIWQRELEGLYHSGGIFVLTLHPFVSGRWVYIKAIETLMKTAKTYNDLWITTIDQVADYCLKNKNAPYMIKRPLPPEVPFNY